MSKYFILQSIEYTFNIMLHYNLVSINKISRFSGNFNLVDRGVPRSWVINAVYYLYYIFSFKLSIMHYY